MSASGENTSEHPPESLRAFPPLSHRGAMWEGGRSRRGGAALAREPSFGARRFHALRVMRSRNG